MKWKVTVIKENEYEEIDTVKIGSNACFPALQAWLFQRVEEGGERDALLAFQWLYLMVSGNQPIGPESVALEIGAFCGREFYRTRVKGMDIVMELRRH